MTHRFAGRLLSSLLLAGLAVTAAHAQNPSSAAAQAIPFPIETVPPVTRGVAAAAPAALPMPAASVRLYALDCGQVQLPDLGMFSDTGEYDGVRGTLVTPCFLVVHPSGTLLWDTGLSDQLAGKGPVTVEGGAVLQVERSLQATACSSSAFRRSTTSAFRTSTSTTRAMRACSARRRGW